MKYKLSIFEKNISNKLIGYIVKYAFFEKVKYCSEIYYKKKRSFMNKSSGQKL